MMMQAMTSFPVCRISSDLLDDDWATVCYAFTMRYSTESLRNGFNEYVKKKGEKEDLLEELRLAGYTEEDIAKRMK